MKWFLRLVICFLLLLKSISSSADTLDNYQFYIKNLLLVTESGFPLYGSTPKYPMLDGSNYDDTIRISYSHCASGYTGRHMRLLTSDGMVLKEWKYDDPEIRIPISTILSISSVRPADSLLMQYYNNEDPQPVRLTWLIIGNFDRKAVTATRNGRIPWTVLGLVVFAVLAGIYLKNRRQSAVDSYHNNH